MIYKKTKEEREQEKEQKQLEMVQLEVKYEQFLAEKIKEKRKALLSKNPNLKTIFEGWIYGVYIAILDNQQLDERKGKLYYLFENIPEAKNRYKLPYRIDDENNCLFDVAKLKIFPKPYLTILKRHHLDIKKESLTIAELVASHQCKLDESAYIHHCDYDNLNNSIKNLAPLDKEFFDSLDKEKQKTISKAHQQTPEKYLVELKKKPKDVVKMEYRACDLYYNHRIPVAKIAATLRNRMKKAEILRTVKLYRYFRSYSHVEPHEETV